MGALDEMKWVCRGMWGLAIKSLFSFLDVCVLSIWLYPGAVANQKECLGSSSMPRTSWRAPSAWRSSRAYLPWMATCGPTGGWGLLPASNRLAGASPPPSQAVCCLLCFAAIREWGEPHECTWGGTVLSCGECLSFDTGSQSDQTVPTSTGLVNKDQKQRC